MKKFLLITIIAFMSIVTNAQKVQVVRVEGVSISAFTASKKECGKSDGITASGVKVHDGVIACNFLPFGTKVRIPSMYGDKVFTVYCRLKKGYVNHVDIYTKLVSTALRIGRRTCDIEVIS